MERESFVFYRSFWESIKELPRDIQGEVLTAIVEYGLYGETTENPKPIAGAILTLIKPIIEANNQRFLNGLKGGAPKGNQNASKKQPKNNQIQPENNQETTKKQPNVNVNDNVNVIERESHAHTHTREEENTQNEKNEFSSEAERYAQMDNESFFLELWKKARMFYLKQETNYPKLSFVQKQNLEIILKDFTRRELWEGIHGLMIQDVSDLNGGNAMKLTPDHILRYENFTKYLNAGKTNQQLYVKNQPPKQPKRPKREVGDL